MEVGAQPHPHFPRSFLDSLHPLCPVNTSGVILCVNLMPSCPWTPPSGWALVSQVCMCQMSNQLHWDVPQGFWVGESRPCLIVMESQLSEQCDCRVRPPSKSFVPVLRFRLPDLPCEQSEMGSRLVVLPQCPMDEDSKILQRNKRNLW